MISLDRVKKLISTQGLNWTAKETPISKNFIPGNLAGFGLALDDSESQHKFHSSSELEDSLSGIKLEPSKVWDPKNDITTPKDQGNCGSCVAFATCAVIEARLVIKNNHPWNIDLSEAHLFFCGAGAAACDSGWNFKDALEFASNIGIGEEKDFEYSPKLKECKVTDPYVYVDGYKSVKGNTEVIKKLIALNGPVLAGMRVFTDFLYYQGGVYRPVTQDIAGLHAVAITGYHDEEGCWYIKNSWGDKWGSQGFAKIAYGTCGIGTEFAVYDMDLKLANNDMS